MQHQRSISIAFRLCRLKTNKVVIADPHPGTAFKVTDIIRVPSQSAPPILISGAEIFGIFNVLLAVHNAEAALLTAEELNIKTGSVSADPSLHTGSKGAPQGTAPKRA